MRNCHALITLLAAALITIGFYAQPCFAEDEGAIGFRTLPAPPADSVVSYARWTPAVIFGDGSDKTKLEVYFKSSVRKVKLYTGSSFIADLNDDGEDGDARAGDNIWTVGGLTKNAYSYQMGDYGIYGYNVKITRHGGSEETYNNLPSLGLVKRQKTKSWKVKRNVYASRYTLFLIDKQGRFLDGKLPLCAVYCGKSNKQVFREFYKYYNDKFDFLTVMPVCTIYRPNDYAENVPYCVPVQNKVRNIGVPIFDDTAEFGSKGRLQSIVYHSFGYGAILDHEVDHNWGIKIGDALAFSGANCQYGQTYGWHYSPYSTLTGQMAAFPHLELSDNGDGTYNVKKYSYGGDYGMTDRCYSKLTLYLMGLVPPDDVPPVMILTDPDYPNYSKIPASKFDSFTIEEITVANGGERSPAYPNTQKKFRMGLIVVTDHKPRAAEVDYFASLIKYFASKDEGKAYLQPFNTATGGRATLKTKMPKARVLK